MKCELLSKRLFIIALNKRRFLSFHPKLLDRAALEIFQFVEIKLTLHFFRCFTVEIADYKSRYIKLQR